MTLPRHLHRAVLRLLRPAEAAVRRLVIVAARGLVVELRPARPRKPKPKSAFLRNGVGTGILMPPALPGTVYFFPQKGAAASGPDIGGKKVNCPRRPLRLPLVDPLPRWRRSRPAASGIPRISFPGFSAPHPVPVRRPPLPDDPLDATRLALRLSALASALDDLPAEARRFARWRARRRPESSPVYRGGAVEGARRRAVRRISPLRPGRPPGLSAANRRRPGHEVHEVLGDLQYFAFKALERPDTS